MWKKKAILFRLPRLRNALKRSIPPTLFRSGSFSWLWARDGLLRFLQFIGTIPIAKKTRTHAMILFYYELTVAQLQTVTCLRFYFRSAKEILKLNNSAPPLGGMYRNPEWCSGQTSSLWAALNATGCTIDFFLSKSASLIKKTKLISAPVTPEHHLRKVEQLGTIAGGKPHLARHSNY